MSAPSPPLLARHGALKVIGAGGVGGPLARYSALYLASLDDELPLVLVDGDAFEPANAARMFFARAGNKAAVLAEELSRHVGEALLVTAVEEYVTPDNVARLVREDDLVLLAVDNHATRKLIADRCAALADVCLISGGNDGVGTDGGGSERAGTYGNVQVHWRENGVDRTPPITRLHPEIDSPSDHRPDEASCAELMASVPQLLFTNLQTATAMLNALRAYLEDDLRYAEACFDVLDARMRPTLPVTVEPMSQA
ncbi:MAG: ThiF family adenylyltransferase [Planctomycetota bacterium]|nr:ThiF family adenylyltransferase [Planctomycetota bacterium]